MILLKDYRLPKGLLKLDIAVAYHGYFAERGTAYIPSKEVQHKYFFPVSNKGEFIDRLGHPITAERIAGTCFHSDSEGFKLYYNEGKFHKKDGGIPELNVFRHCASLVETGQDIAGIGIWYKGAPFITLGYDNRGRLNLSRKEALPKPAVKEEKAEKKDKKAKKESKK